jgi:prostaglandin-endoperoxide synthase 2
MRDNSRDGFFNRAQAYLFARFGWFWRAIDRWPWARRWLNWYLIGTAASRAPRRPHPLSTMHDSEFTSWESLTDKTWNGRHLPPMPQLEVDRLPKVEDVAKLFERPATGFVECPKSTMLFPAFAQWLTDGFLRTDARNYRKNHSAHEIDASQLYGETPTQTKALRTYQAGRLKSQRIGGEEYSPYLFAPNGGPKFPEFEVLPDPLHLPPNWPADKRAELFAFGGERANSTPHTAMVNTLFLREHNRIAGELALAEPAWDDERLFQTARNIIIVLVIKIAVEDYINHISPFAFRLRADPEIAWKADWNRPNWMTAEFNLLYRWHSLVRTSYSWPTGDVVGGSDLFHNRLLIQVGLGQAFEACSQQPAGRIGLFNTPAFLANIELRSLQQGRTVRLATYNDYRELIGYPRVDRFEQITGDPERVDALRKLYGTPDKVEFYVGLFAEDARPTAAVPALIGRFVALDALSQALANPLLAEAVFTPKTFGNKGMEIIKNTTSLQDLLNRNTTGGPYLATMTRQTPGTSAIHGPPI